LKAVKRLFLNNKKRRYNMKILEAIKGMSNAADLLAVVAAVRGRVKELPDEEQTKYYETDKEEDKQLGEEIKEDDATEGKPGEEPAPNAEEEKEIPNDEAPAKGNPENPPTDEAPPAERPNDTPPQKEDAMSILLEMRDMLKQNLSLEKQEQEEIPKSDEELEKPTPTDEEESYEDEDFFK
jgi:hypothetical protein